MRRVILVTGHYLESARKAGFHGLADAFWRAGDEVIFVTAAISWLSLLRGNHRAKFPIRREANHLRWVKPRLGSYVYWTNWHPADLRNGLLNLLSSSWFAKHGEQPLGDLTGLLRGADLVVFECTPGLMHFPKFRVTNPHARYVYRVSDDMRTLQVHPVVRQAEEQVLADFDRISSPTETIHARFRHLPQAHLDGHGIDKDVFDQPVASPYRGKARTNAVFVGVSKFDARFLATAARMFDDWDFHIIGPIDALPRRRNIIAHGLCQFADTVPFLRHADVGLHCLEEGPGVEAFADSLKVVQYTYCCLPIVAPECLRSDRTHVFCYRPKDPESIRKALQAARAYDRTKIDPATVPSWDDVAAKCWE